jgi:hypothetical protein
LIARFFDELALEAIDFNADPKTTTPFFNFEIRPKNNTFVAIKN